MNGNDTTTDTGKRGEAQAAVFLEQHGLKVVARNYRCRGGELDLVCREGRTLVFKTRRKGQKHARQQRLGGAAASITPTKQRRILHAALHYLSTSGQTDADCRIDCVLIDDGAVTWLKNAIAGD